MEMINKNSNEIPEKHLIKKTIGIAALVASLGASLGVNPAILMADDPTNFSNKNYMNKSIQADQYKISDQYKVESQKNFSNQYKISDQHKISNQHKVSDQIKISDQMKWD